ncbi:sulfatase-like hydrolase/transferase [Rubrobacter indicoceani]|uniref:sulfatase-like hydrolase/transferase n=1 Tax=Rubrobacter indicoceani TaxID=2051957 RepID=UPI001F09EFC9|nr:sulfatase-like hydrolase/transferase [Rubrobacter indicoceani]
MYLLSLLAPVLFYNIALKVLRVTGQSYPPGFFGFVDQVRSDVLFNFGFALLWVGLFAVFRSRSARIPVLVVFHLSCLLLLILNTGSHFYYATTGSTLDYALIVRTFRTFGEVSGVIATEVTVVRMLLISAVLLYAVAGPAVVVRLVTGAWRLPVFTEDESPAGERSGGHGYRKTAALGGAAAALVTLSALPSMTGASNTFTRDTVMNLIMTEVASSRIDQAQISANTRTTDLPTDARLAETPETNKKNVVMVFLESERASATSLYNKDLDTTPVLEELAENSLVAENAYAVVPHTSKSMVSAHCGIEPPLDTRMTESEANGIPARCLPELLGDEGYRSVFFQSATQNFERRPQLIENFGYDDFYPLEALPKAGFDVVNYFGYEDDIMLGPSERWLRANSDQPFMASYLTITTHHDYNVPPDFPKKRYVENDLYNDYLNTVAYQDQFLGNLIQQYKDLGLYKDTVFVVMADHGEAFGEHNGLMQHDNVPYDESLKIPLVIHDGSRFSGGETVEKPVQNISVLKTVSDLLGYRIENNTYRSYSLLDEARIPDRLRMSCWTENRCLSLVEGDQKYIYHFANRAEEFFDLSEDPGETENLAEEKSDRELQRARYDLLGWQAQVRADYEQHLAENPDREETTDTE